MKQLKPKATWIAAAIAVAVSVGSVAGYLQRSARQAANDSPESAATFEPVVEGFGRESIGRSPQFLATAKTALLQATPVAERLPQISTGRSDPFISPFIPAQPAIADKARPNRAPTAEATANPAPAAAAPSPPPTATAPSAPVALQPLPAARSPQALPPVPASLPSLSVANQPLSLPVAAAPRASGAAAIQISGVMQLADQISILVQEPNAETGRYVQVGDYLANGQVRISRVEWASGQDPVVILEQAGREYVKTVGGASLAQAR
ncbi:MAG: hypothetical protein F6K04_12045 [Leptolyngbya sp. SIO4C5]|nr:hypothetical protein [Leptolyngbya sp. SIO4C5]